MRFEEAVLLVGYTLTIGSLAIALHLLVETVYVPIYGPILATLVVRLNLIIGVTGFLFWGLGHFASKDLEGEE